MWRDPNEQPAQQNREPNTKLKNRVLFPHNFGHKNNNSGNNNNINTNNSSNDNQSNNTTNTNSTSNTNTSFTNTNINTYDEIPPTPLIDHTPTTTEATQPATPPESNSPNKRHAEIDLNLTKGVHLVNNSDVSIPVLITKPSPANYILILVFFIFFISKF